MEEELKIIEELVSKSNKNSEDYDRLEEFDKPTGTFYINNDFIVIEYHSLFEKYRAIKMLEVMDEYPDIYKNILVGKEKIVFVDNKINDDKIICFGNGVYVKEFSHLFLLSVFTNNSIFCTSIYKRMKSDEDLVTMAEKLVLLKQYKLNKIRTSGGIDFFTYKELVKGGGDEVYRSKLIAIDLAFNKGYYNFLKLVLKDSPIDDKELVELICYFTYEECDIALFNDLLKFQNNELNRDCTRFLKDNLIMLSRLFDDEIGNVMNMYHDFDDKSSKRLSREEIIREVRDVLIDIDPTQFLLKIFDENVLNGKIMLWDSNDTEMRRVMYKKYNQYFDIDSPLLYSYSVDDGNSRDFVVNVPLNFRVSNVVTIVHELLHLNAFFHGNRKSSDLNEFPSIYFEEYARKKLMSKGYEAYELYSSKNSRVFSTLFCYYNVSPAIFWLNLYREKGKLNFQEIDSLIRGSWKSIYNECEAKGLSKIEINEVLEKNGLVPNIDASTSHVIKNVNNILLLQNTSVFEGYLYVLATVVTNIAIRNNVDMQVVLDISNHLHDINDYNSILKKLGVDMEKYGFVDLKDDDSRDGGRDKR